MAKLLSPEKEALLRTWKAWATCPENIRRAVRRKFRRMPSKEVLKTIQRANSGLGGA